jgi:hypothetical protein
MKNSHKPTSDAPSHQSSAMDPFMLPVPWTPFFAEMVVVMERMHGTLTVGSATPRFRRALSQ